MTQRIFGTRNLDFHSLRLIATSYTEQTGLYRSTVIQISFDYKLSGIHVLEYPSETIVFLSDKTCQNKETRFLTETFSVKHYEPEGCENKKREKLVQIYLFATPAQ